MMKLLIPVLILTITLGSLTAQLVERDEIIENCEIYSNDKSYCKQCKLGYFLPYETKKECYKCDFNCEMKFGRDACVELKGCKICKRGFKISSPNKCAKKISNPPRNLELKYIIGPFLGFAIFSSIFYYFLIGKNSD